MNFGGYTLIWRRVFDGAQAARNALKESFEKCLAETKAARKESLLGFPRSSSKQKADDKLREYIDAGFEGVTTMVTNLDNDWKKSHSKVYNNFQGLCDTVNSHKAVFALFPSQSLYGSVLCGSFTLLINVCIPLRRPMSLPIFIADISRPLLITMK